MAARVLMVHNYYRSELPSGENRSFEDEAALLETNGHQVVRYVRRSDEIETFSVAKKLALPFKTVWARDSMRSLADLINKHKPDVVHFENTFPLISPSAYYACKAARVPIVQALPNFRMTCVNGSLFRDGVPCEDCLGKAVQWPGILHKCYRDSRALSAIIAAMNGVHNAIGTWDRGIDLYVAGSEFTRAKFIEAGLPERKIVVKPNFVEPDPGCGAHDGNFAIFVGRLTVEKGLGTLLKAWRPAVLEGSPRLVVVGDGPLRQQVQQLAAGPSASVEYLGQLPSDSVRRLLQQATLTVCPSESYETFGRVAVESFATGCPVIASDLGGLRELVRPGELGLHFAAGDGDSLRRQLQWAFAHQDEMRRMGERARGEFEQRFTAEANYRQLIGIYHEVMK